MSAQTGKPIRSVARAAVVALVAALAMAGLTGVATAAATNYAALGDSYSSGVGAGGTGTCGRSNRAYPPLWRNSHPVSAFAFVACGGATTDDVLANQVSALSASTTLVSITIGGNDAGFADVMTTCKLGSDAQCLARVEESRQYAKEVLPAKLDRTYAEITRRAPNAKVAVLGYPRLFDPARFCDMNRTKVTALNTAADELSTIISQRVAAAGARFAYGDVRSRFAAHGVCSSAPWLNGFVLFPVSDSYHPNVAGQANGYLPALNAITG